jgi:hypothetical protein
MIVHSGWCAASRAAPVARSVVQPPCPADSTECGSRCAGWMNACTCTGSGRSTRKLVNWPAVNPVMTLSQNAVAAVLPGSCRTSHRPGNWLHCTAPPRGSRRRCGPTSAGLQPNSRRRRLGSVDSPGRPAPWVREERWRGARRASLPSGGVSSPRHHERPAGKAGGHETVPGPGGGAGLAGGGAHRGSAYAGRTAGLRFHAVSASWLSAQRGWLLASRALRSGHLHHRDRNHRWRPYLEPARHPGRAADR